MTSRRATRSPATVWLVTVLCSTLTGCAATTQLFAGAVESVFIPTKRVEGEIPEPEPNDCTATSSCKAQVGTARVDFTPTPGIAMNYNLEGKVSRGFWTRLYARAVYLQDASGTALVFVSAELPHIPNGLHDKVAELVSRNDAIDHLGPKHIVVAATHTHHGPENYFSDEFYNGMVSARSGFDRELFKFLSKRIAEAIAQAHADRQELTEVRYRSAMLEDFVRNRSLAPFLRNEEAKAYVDARKSKVTGSCPLVEGQTDERACWAVRSRVEVVDLLARPNGATGSGELLTSMVFLAAHPTVLGPQTEIYQGDLFGVASTLLEQQRVPGCAAYQPETVPIFNGAQGDVSAAWKRRDRYDLLNPGVAGSRMGLAVKLARFVCRKDPGIDPIPSAGPEVHAAKLAYQFERFRLSKRNFETEAKCKPWTEKCTTPKPLPGAPSMGGAQDGRTFWYELGAKEGMRSASRSRHGRKAKGLEVAGVPVEVAESIADPDKPPRKVPIAIFRIGDLVIATLPGEFTTMLGERLRKEIGDTVTTSGTAPERVLLIGLANGHVSYVTTPEEYDAQGYEGAQNLYGAATGPLIEKHFQKVGLRLNNGSATHNGREFDYDPGMCRVFLPREAGLPSFRADDGLQNVLLPLTEPPQPNRGYKSQCWVDAIPKLSKVDPATSGDGACTRALPYVWIEKRNPNSTMQCGAMRASSFARKPCNRRHPDHCQADDPRFCRGGTVPQDNCGLDLVTVMHGAYEDRTRWCAFWMPPAAVDPDDFVICAAGVTNEDPIAQGRSAAGLEPESRVKDIRRVIDRRRECDGEATQPVCVFPSPLTP